MLSKFWRYFLFFFFVIAFLIAAPAVVFYTAGYRFNLSTGQVAQTGLLSITSIPKGADITIDDEKKAERTPSIINNAVPGIHRVHLKKEGYSTWEKQLEVNSRQSTFVSDAVLFLLETETVDPEIFDQAEVDPVFGTIAFLKEGKELWFKMPFSSQTIALLGVSKKEFETAEIVWSPLGRFLLFTTVSNKISQSLLIDTQTKEIWTVPIQTSFLFDVGDSLSGYLLNDGVISKVNFRTHESTKLPFSAQAIRSDGNNTFVVQNNPEHSVLSQIDQQGVAQILAYLPLGEYQFEQTPNDFLLLRDKSRERLLLVDRSGGSEPILLLADADTWDWSPSGTDLIFSDGFGIELYKTLSHTRETITRLSEPIHQLLWYPLGNVIAYQTATQIVALEMDRRGEQNKTVLLRGPSFKQFWFDENGQWLEAFFQGEGTVLLRKQLQK